MTEAKTGTGRGPIAIRDAVPEDRPQLVRFMAALNAFERTLEPNRALGEAAADRHMAYLQDLVARQEGFVLIALGPEGPLGFLLAIVGEAAGGFVVPEARRYGYVTDLFVSESARGRGVARALLAEAESRFRTRGLPSMRLSVLAANEAARAAYRQLGFRPLDIEMIKPLDDS